MRPVVKSVKGKSEGHYKPWGDAKPELIGEIGSFCSYCEKQVTRSALHIEHIKGRKVTNKEGELIYADLCYDWNNFLLACSNCNSTKSNKDIALTNPFLPHRNNLIHFIEIDSEGRVVIKSGIAQDKRSKVQAFIDLVGLDRLPGHPDYSEKDDRWQIRLEARDLAQRQFSKYNSTPRSTDIENIVSLSKEKGFFSVWYYQFSNHPEVLDALINGYNINGAKKIPFIGTHTESFEAPTFMTVERM